MSPGHLDSSRHSSRTENWVPAGAGVMDSRFKEQLDCCYSTRSGAHGIYYTPVSNSNSPWETAATQEGQNCSAPGSGGNEVLVRTSPLPGCWWGVGNHGMSGARRKSDHRIRFAQVWGWGSYISL